MIEFMLAIGAFIVMSAPILAVGVIQNTRFRNEWLETGQAMAIVVFIWIFLWMPSIAFVAMRSQTP